MTYREIQAKLKDLKEDGFTEIALNASKAIIKMSKEDSRWI